MKVKNHIYLYLPNMFQSIDCRRKYVGDNTCLKLLCMWPITFSSIRKTKLPHRTNIMTNLNSKPFCNTVLNTVNHQGVKLFPPVTVILSSTTQVQESYMKTSLSTSSVMQRSSWIVVCSSAYTSYTSTDASWSQKHKEILILPHNFSCALWILNLGTNFVEIMKHKFF